MSHINHKEILTVPVAIALAGAFIGLGIYLGAREIGGTDLQTGVASVKTVSAAPTAAQASAGAVKIAPVTSKDHIRGSLNAKVTIVEYSDTECPFCKQFQSTLKQVVDTYGKNGDVAWVYRHFPLTNLHSKAPKEAEATECAAELGGNEAFWKYVDRIYQVTASNNKLDPAELPRIAQYIGLDVAKFTTCLDSGKYAAKVKAQGADAVAAGGRGTPYSVVVTSKGNTPLSGAVSFDRIESIIKETVGTK